MAEGAFKKALELLARRPHFEREILAKLRDRGFQEADTEAAVRKLQDSGYLDDFRCTHEFIRAKLRRSPLGRRRLRADLVRRGAAAEAIEAALSDPELESEADLVRRAMHQWQLRRGGDRASLMRHLDRRGFSKGDILNVADELGDAGRDTPRS